MPAALIAIVALAGAGVGWVQRGVIIRLAVPAGQPLHADCPSCGHRVLLAGRMSLPALSWSSRCRGCARPIGPPALAVEATTAVLLGVLAYRMGSDPGFPAAAWLVVCGVPLAFVDIAVRRLPDVLTGLAYGGVIAFLALATLTGGTPGDLARAAGGGIVLAAFYLILAVARPSEIGLGDCKAAASAGTMLAWFSWPALLAGTLGALVIAAAYGGVLLISRRATLKAQIA
jgi:leader peptidase (prepilin peptidase)/N-methyltransferase